MTAPQSKPMRTEGEQPAHCYCNHAEHAHPCSGDCTCPAFTPRPCICGHVHLGRCGECVCRKLREDRSPEFVLRQGIRNGEWGIAIIPRFQALMRPEIDPIWRIWACLNIHVMDRRGKLRNQGRLATILQADGKSTLPLAPNDIVNELNKFDTIPRLSRHHVRRELRELERLGLVRVVGKIRKHTRIFLYSRPLESRNLEPMEEPVPRSESAETETNSENFSLGVYPDPQIPPSHTGDEYLRRTVILPIRATLVKTLSRCLREELENASIGKQDLGGQPDPQTLIDQVVEEILLGVWAAYQKLRAGVCLAPQTAPPINKERARASSNSPVRTEAVAPPPVSMPSSSAVLINEKKPAGRQAKEATVRTTPEKPPACLPEWYLELRKTLQHASPPDVISEPMFLKIAGHLTEALLPQFQRAVKDAPGIRKWPGIEAIAKQVAARGLVMKAGAGEGEESLMERMLRVRGMSNG